MLPPLEIHYPTRSEAEAAIILGLVNAGFEYGAVRTLFRKYPCAGKYRELMKDNERQADAWLRRSYHSAKRRAEDGDGPHRAHAGEARAWALSFGWRGAGGASDQSVFAAHCTLAWKAGREEYAASARDLSQLAGVSSATASNSTRRLIQQGLIEKRISSVGANATFYRLRWERQNATLPHPPPSVGECPLLTAHDLFSHHGLGRSAALLVASLIEREGQTADELVQRTGRSEQTVRRTLKKLSHIVIPSTGEIVNMVACENREWMLVRDDFDNLARDLELHGYGNFKRQMHATQRRQYAETLGRLATITTQKGRPTDAQQ